jgi:hypothetical protein
MIFEPKDVGELLVAMLSFWCRLDLFHSSTWPLSFDYFFLSTQSKDFLIPRRAKKIIKIIPRSFGVGSLLYLKISTCVYVAFHDAMAWPVFLIFFIFFGDGREG